MTHRARALTDAVARELHRAALAPGRLTLEVIEHAVIDDLRVVRDQLRAVKALGVGLALDDFGVGHSSLGRLADYPFDRVKLDQSFARRLGQDRRDGVVGTGHPCQRDPSSTLQR